MKRARGGFDSAAYLRTRRAAVDRALREAISRCGAPAPLRRAMNYSLFPGGKRFRALLAIAAAEAAGGTVRQALPFACAVELVHTYSLIHDDLPAMDNDDLRRGIPTVHRAFGEALAILAGDALLTEAFRVASREAQRVEAGPQRALAGVARLAAAAGPGGMVGGQVADIGCVGRRRIGVRKIESMHRRKTGALISAAVDLGALAAGAAAGERRKLAAYGSALGLAFQIVDDLLDCATEARPGVSYAALVGRAAAARRARMLLRTARAELRPFGRRAAGLRILVQMMDERLRGVA